MAVSEIRIETVVEKHCRILCEIRLERTSWIFSDRCRDFLSKKFSLKKDDIWIEEATPKYRSKFADKVMILMNNKLEKYEDLLPKDRNSFYPDIQPFYYIYTKIESEEHKKKILKELNEELKLYVF